MGIFTRVRDIVNSNINAALDKAEDPEKLVRHMIREMEDTLVEIKASCAGTMASKKKAERDASRSEDRTDVWAQRAQLAVDRGRDSLAREALAVRRTYSEETRAAADAAEQLASLVDQYQSDIRLIEEKLQTARERQRILVQRHIHAVQQRRAHEEIRRFDTAAAFARFDTLEHRLDFVESEAELVNFGRPKNLDDQFADLENEISIEEELSALKNRRHVPEASAAV